MAASSLDRLTTSDLRAVLGAAAILQRNSSPATLGQRVVAAARHIVSCDSGSLDALDLRNGQFGHIWADDDLERAFPVLSEPFVTLLPQHPLLASGRREDLLIPRRFSDVMTPAELQALALYNEFYQPLGVDWQLAVGTSGMPLHTVALNRHGMDFSQRDILVLQVFMPHVEAAIRVSALVKTLVGRCRTLEQALDRNREAVITVTVEGALVHATPSARAAVERCLGPRAFASNRLPGPLARWLSAQLVSRELPASDVVFRLEGQGHGVDVTLVRGEGIHTLVLRPRPEVLLTPREVQVLEWVEQGMTNAAIATLCGISIRTVHKHLQHAFEKLNVETRGAAVRKWRDSGS